MNKNEIRDAARIAWRIVWAFRWVTAMLLYLCAVTPGGINWDWFVTT